MTVPSTPRRAGPFYGNGSTTQFPFLFKVYTRADVQFVVQQPGGDAITLTLDVDYLVTLNADQDSSPGGLITYPISGSPLASGGVAAIIGNLPNTQPTDLPDGGAYRARSVETMGDRIVMLVQQVAERQDRTFTFPPTEGIIPEFPPISERANRLLGFDSNGQFVGVLPAPGSATSLALDLLNASLQSKGPALIGFGDLDYTGNTAGAKLREIRSIRDKGALPGNADNLTQVNAALSAQRLLLAPVGDYAVSTDFTNPLGSEFWGPGRLLKPVPSGTQQLNLTADKYQHVFGQEYLFAAYNKLRARTPFTLLFAGDSTTAGDSIVDPNALIHTLVKDLVADYGFKISTVNSGVSGINTEQWRTTYLPAQLATNPEAMVIRLGINDPGWNKDGSAGTLNQWEAEKANRRDITDFATSLRSALTTIRTAKSVDVMSIILMTPNSTSDSANGRDEKWDEAVRLVVREAARDFQCAFIDTYALIPDSRTAPNRYMDQPAGLTGGPAIHPLDIMNRMIAPYIAELLVPDGLAYTNTSSAAGAPNITTAPQAYPIGYSTWRVTWTINNFVVNGALLNFRTADDVSQQIVWPFNAEMRPCVRTSDTAGTNWRDWSSGPPNGLTLSGGWSASGKNLTYEKVNGVVHLSGRIGGGTITAGTVIATLPAGYRPQFDQYFPITCGAGLATVGIISVIAATGAITVVNVSNNTLLDPSGVHFSIY